MNKPLYILVGLLAVSGSAHAACASKSKTIFSCATTNGKYVEVCDAGSTIGYSFGKKGATPELALKIPRDEVTTAQWNGIGRYIYYAVNIRNGDALYSVYSSTDKNSKRQETEWGINVEVSGNQAATIKCSPKSVVDNMEGVELREQE